MSTAWDILQGIWAATAACKNWRPNIVHARSYVVALVALWVKGLTGARFLFDIRGFWPEERVEGGLWRPNGWLYQVTKWWESRYFKAADAVVVLSEKGRAILESRLKQTGAKIPVVMIPTCVDMNRFVPQETRSRNGDPLHLAYVGSVGTWYMLKEMADFFLVFQETVPNARWSILTNRPDPTLGRELKRLDPASYRIDIMSHEEVPIRLKSMQATLCFIKPVSSKLACCPTKVGESLACGLPVVVTAGTGDCDDVVEREKVGVVLREFGRDSYHAAALELQALLKEGPVLSQRCRRIAMDYFDLERGVDRYVELYQRILKKGRE